MSTKLVKINLAEGLHRRVKTVAASRDIKIEDYIAEILEEHVPKTITFTEEPPARKRVPKAVN